MRKVIFLISTSLILLIVLFSYFFYNNKNIKIENKIESKEQIEEKLKEDDVIDDIQNNEQINENYNDNDTNANISYSENNTNNMEFNNTSNYNVINDNSQNESYSSQIGTSSNISHNEDNNILQSKTEPEPVIELTEWEKLGISEYDYYNTPNENEGEVAFRGDASLCKNEINRLINLYYDSGIDGGNYYTINGKYTHSYIGCGIKMYMNGNSYTYNQIKSMGFN